MEHNYRKKKCKECQMCYDKFTIEQALGTFQWMFMQEIDRLDEDEGQDHSCERNRLAISYSLIEKTLREHGLCK
jgi:hypothetical protein